MKRKTLFLALALCALSAPAAMAQSDLGLKAVGGAIGYVSPEDLDGSFSLGALADFGTMMPNVGLEARLDFWSQSEGDAYSEVSISDVILGARGKYYFPTSSPNLRPFAGAGLAMHFISAEVTTSVPGFPTMTADDSETRLGFDLGGGMAMPVNPRTDFMAEAWYSIVSDVSQFSLRAGLSFRIGQ